jgi:FixJ family two-component response regulator
MPYLTQESSLVHVVDDDSSMRDALESLLDSVGLVSRTYRTASDFLAARVPDRPGCVVIDIRLSDMNGLEFQRKLIDIGVRLPVAMMTGHGDIAMTVKAMKRGAMDILTKPFDHQDLLDAVMTATERDRQRRLVEVNVSPLAESFRSLSPRERDVMLLVTAGIMNKQVAGDLGISEITAKVHRGAAMRKMGARTLVDLVRMADIVKPKQV